MLAIDGGITNRLTMDFFLFIFRNLHNVIYRNLRSVIAISFIFATLAIGLPISTSTSLDVPGHADDRFFPAFLGLRGGAGESQPPSFYEEEMDRSLDTQDLFEYKIGRWKGRSERETESKRAHKVLDM